MSEMPAKAVSRRRFLKTAGATALAAGVGPAVIIPGSAQPKTLKLLYPRTFAPGFDRWFDRYAQDWGERNNTQVVVDRLAWGGISNLLKEEIKAQRGHDLVTLVAVPGQEDELINHREIYEECQRRYGKAIDFAIKSTYDPKAKRFLSFCPEYYAHPVIYRKDLWDAIGKAPNTWEDIRQGGRHIKLLHEHPVGIALATRNAMGPVNPNSERALRAILYSFGGSVQDAGQQPALKSKQSLAALEYVKALYEETMTDEVLTWDITSNNRFMLSGEGSLTIDSIAIARTSEKKQFPVSDRNLRLAKIPSGPVQRLGPPASHTWLGIWKFAVNIDSAKQFLVDYIGNFREAFLASEFYNFPCFPSTVPDLKSLLAIDAKADPSDKYQVLADVKDWTVNRGYPGYENRAVMEVYGSGLIADMFAAATGKMTSDEALTQANQEVRKIYDKWRTLGKI